MRIVFSIKEQIEMAFNWLVVLLTQGISVLAQLDCRLVRWWQLKQSQQAAQKRDPGFQRCHFSLAKTWSSFFFSSSEKVIISYDQSSFAIILQLELSLAHPKGIGIFFQLNIFNWNFQLNLIEKQRVGT